MLRHVDVGKLSITRYRRLIEPALFEEVRALARPLRHARVLHLNATPYGGGVAELLRSEVAAHFLMPRLIRDELRLLARLA
jgi:trehalose synthase